MHSFLIFLCADGFVSVCVNLEFVSIFRASVRGVLDLVRSGLLCVLLSGVPRLQLEVRVCFHSMCTRF